MISARDSSSERVYTRFSVSIRTFFSSIRWAMQSGVVFGEVARVDGLLDRVFAELGEEAPVVLTGSGAGRLAPLVSHAAVVDKTLTLRGLHQLRLGVVRRR